MITCWIYFKVTIKLISRGLITFVFTPMFWASLFLTIVNHQRYAGVVISASAYKEILGLYAQVVAALLGIYFAIVIMLTTTNQSPRDEHMQLLFCTGIALISSLSFSIFGFELCSIYPIGRTAINLLFLEFFFVYAISSIIVLTFRFFFPVDKQKESIKRWIESNS